MGIAALNFTEGILKSKNCHKMKLLLLTALAAVAVAEPYYGYGYYGFPYGHQQAWPGVRAPGFSSTCFGCRGKRSAEAEAEPAYGFYGYHPYAYGFYRPYGIATSYEQRSPQGLRGKRSADEAAPAEADKVFGDSPAKPRGQLKPNPRLKPKPKLPPTTTVITVTNLTGPATTLPDSPPLFGELVERDPLNQLMAIMDTPMDIMDTVMAPESPDILLVPLTPSEAPKVLASKMQYVAS